MLNEKDTLITEKVSELNRLKQKLGEDVDTDDEADDSSTAESIKEKVDRKSEKILKYDEENMNNMRALYDHQIELLKVKIQMLEKTCLNYKQGIKDMNKSFGYQQQTDEMSSIQIFKDMMQELQKTNAHLETERIDLQVIF